MFFLASYFPFPVYATPPAGNSLIVVLIPSLKLEDLSAYANLQRLAQTSAVGLMNSSNAGVRRITSAYLTMSAGAKAACPDREGKLGLQINETIDNLQAKDVYERFLGETVADTGIILPYFQSIINANSNGVTPGLLGETLKQAKIPFLFMGNHDLPQTIARPGLLLVADTAGRVEEGYVDEQTYLLSPYSPTYYTSNYPFLWEKTCAFLSKQNGIVFLDLADLVRLDTQADRLSPAVYEGARRKLLAEMDTFLGNLLNLIEDSQASLLLVTPYPDRDSLLLGNTLTPVIYRTPAGSSGLLSSSSTKRPGIITNLDIGPAILQWAQVAQPPAFIGAPFKLSPQPRPLDYLTEQLSGIIVNYQQRPFLLKGYVLLQIIVVLSVITLILLRHPLLGRLSPLLLALTTGPLLFLLLPLLPGNSLYLRTVVLCAAAIFAVYLLEIRKNVINTLALLYLLTAGSIAADLLLGAPLMKTSILGYDAISGSRFYGLGNEYMGVLLGSSLIGISLLVETLTGKYPRHTWVILGSVSVILAGLICLLAAPQWGTNVGGAFSFVGSTLLLLLLFYGKKITLRTYSTIALSCAASVALLFLIDLHRPVEVQSHIGLTARLLQEQGLTALLPIISRKVSMNIKLLQYSLWTRVFLTFLGASALIFYRPPGMLKEIFTEYPYLKAGFIAGLSGSFLALLANDSGIVAAATSSIFVVPTLLYLITRRSA